MTRTLHEYTATIIGSSTRLRPTNGFVLFDEAWAPYIGAEIVAPMVSPEVRDLLDPREHARVRVSCVARFGTPTPVADVTADVGGDLAVINAAWSDRTLRSITADYTTPYNTFGVRDSQVLQADLAVRSVVDDPIDGTTTIRLGSDEVLAQDYKLVTSQPVDLATTSVRTATEFVLAAIGADLQPGPADGTIDAASTVWEPGTSAWDFLVPLVEAAGLRLWCDERRRWWLTPPLTFGSDVYAATSSSLVDDQHAMDVEEGYADAVVIRYTWVDALGATQVAYDTAGSPRARKVIRLDRDRPIPAIGAAAYVLDRTRRRGLSKSLVQVSDYTVRPGHTVVASGEAGVFYGLASAVEFSLESDEMRVRTRELTEATRYSWGTQPVGHRWQDVPVGVSWTDYEPPEEF